MDQLLNELNDLSEKQVQQLLSKKEKMPFVTFSMATLKDCERSDGLALDLRFIEPCVIPAPSLRIPQEIITPVPSDFLCHHLLTIQKVIVLDNEKACRMLIDAILLEVLCNESDKKLFGFCQVKNDWERFWTLVFWLRKQKKEWPDSAVSKVMCEAGCLLKNRLAVGKNMPVFAVLSNGDFFRFFAIDTDGIVYSSGIAPLILKLGPEGDYTNSPSLSEILRWFTWFIKSIKSVSTRAFNEDKSDQEIADSLAQIRNCFGHKYPISSKKIKIQK